jgi:hypothetical protein
MRRLNTSTFLTIALLLVHSAHADTNAETSAAAPTAGKPDRPAGGSPPSEAETVSSRPQERPAEPASREEICHMIEAAAAKEALPMSFFARLIWRESRFNPRAVSPAGAQGIAQFMPFVANGRGLADPFDPLPALLESAEYLGELLRRFGNLGLAAAAYNAGPKRVQDWLAKRGILRQETRDYVAIITGHRPAAWAAGAPPSAADAEDFRCAETHKIARQRPPAPDPEAGVETNAAERGDARASKAASIAKMAQQRRKASDARRQQAGTSRKPQIAAKQGAVRVAALSTVSRRNTKAPARASGSSGRTAASRAQPAHRARVADSRRAAASRQCMTAKGRKECRSA